jgi:hypothetical protein
MNEQNAVEQQRQQQDIKAALGPVSNYLPWAQEADGPLDLFVEGLRAFYKDLEHGPKWRGATLGVERLNEFFPWLQSGREATADDFVEEGIYQLWLSIGGEPNTAAKQPLYTRNHDGLVDLHVMGIYVRLLSCRPPTPSVSASIMRHELQYPWLTSKTQEVVAKIVDDAAVLAALKRTFPWLGTSEEGNGADTVDSLNDLYAAAGGLSDEEDFDGHYEDDGATPSLEYKKERLRDAGYLVGERDPDRNSAFPGSFMVATHETAGNSQFCIVGDDLDELVFEAYERHVS